MILFLIQSTLPLFLLLMVYHLFLEKERMHQFKRFYLLFSLVFSFVIPFVTIEIASKIIQPVVNTSNLLFAQGSSQIIAETNYTAYLLWAIYGLVTLVCSIRFIRNILKITSKTKTNTTIDYYGAKLVLIPEKNLPHTFLNYIFINETDYKNRNIEAELYTHELTHVTQKHSHDILLIEFLKTIFWFNPIFIFYKKAIQLNHEFLADEFVIHYYEDIPFYQSLLVSKANISQPLYLVSNLNFLVTKKRLLMMTKTTTQTKAILKQIALIPVFAILFYSISFKTVAMENPPSHSIQTKSRDSKNKLTKANTVLQKEVIEKTAVAKPLVNTNDTNSNILADTIARKTQPITETTQPEFPGGIVAFYKFIGTNFKVPAELKGGGKIYLTFIVEKDGSLSEFEILKDIGFGTGEEVIRVLKLSPKWTPGKENNETVRVKYSLPIQVEASK
ncbi:regulatory sensor-transducer, BlaR1/MecR1 family protein [Flavobacterium sp. ZT3R18]|uniref:M56 family metallopeptidase n=1 Tax=Flavobacterium sp. ZT3R18 TaxID=2594429 RepID=UPI00117B87F3|nr:M56 family metallopeptidase [Flavobacterium sp. ZT3R18]TRX34074.1 regulatory sensor-transducer, BlaR1/MecR1 family protein [Flavobacterium sp. ZT3R18]